MGRGEHENKREKRVKTGCPKVPEVTASRQSVANWLLTGGLQSRGLPPKTRFLRLLQYYMYGYIACGIIWANLVIPQSGKN